MDLATIGAHCAVPACRQLDFLPISCSCAQQFCSLHFLPDAHDCPNPPPTATPLHRLQRCALVHCPNPSLEAYLSNSSHVSGRVPALCTSCQLAYCPQHRAPSSHNCSVSKPTPEPKNPTAHALLAKHFPSRATNSFTRPSKAPVYDAKTNRKLELMKMRHRASPAHPKDTGVSSPMGQRLHVKVKTDDAAAGEKILWLPTTVSAGRALDLLAAQFGITPTTTPLQLWTAGEGSDAARLLLDADKLLIDQIEDGASLLVATISTAV